jgi:type IX secretion system PorP/SprF family membrane protein
MKKMIMKYFLNWKCIFFLVSTLQGFSQLDPLYTQYMFNELQVNPGYAGSRDCPAAVMLYRNQWTQLDGAPVTVTASVHSPLEGTEFAGGINFIGDKIGITRRTGIQFVGSYKLKMAEGSLRFGLQTGVQFLNEDLSLLNIQNDLQFNSGGVKRMAPTFGYGAYYSNETFYAGYSIPSMLTSSLYSSGSAFKAHTRMSFVSMTHIITAGAAIPVHSDFRIRPNAMIKLNPSANVQLDININGLYKERVWTGLGFRTGESVNFLMGMQINSQLRMGYSFDYNISSIQNYAGSTHEVMLGYDLDISHGRIVHPRFF